RLGRRQLAGPPACGRRRAAFCPLERWVHGDRGLRADARGADVGYGALRTVAVRARGLGRRKGEGDGRRRRVRRVALLADGPVLRPAAAPGDGGARLATRGV